MLLLCLSLATLLALRSAALSNSTSPLRTFEGRDPVTGRLLQCVRCPPGTFLSRGCTETRPSECAPCLAGSYTALWNYVSRCLRCADCGPNKVMKSTCTAEGDTVCECMEGFYFRAEYDMCVRHRACPPGSGVLSLGTPEQDTVCKPCSNHTFSDVVSPQQNCARHRRCSDGNKLQVLNGTSWHDSVCVSCTEWKDGVDVTQILPSFSHTHLLNHRRPPQITLSLDMNSPEQIKELLSLLRKGRAPRHLRKRVRRVNRMLETECGPRNKAEGL